jgi:Recombination endonuclease VII
MSKIGQCNVCGETRKLEKNGKRCHRCGYQARKDRFAAPSSPEPDRECARCCVSKPASAFHRVGPGQRRAQCGECRAATRGPRTKTYPPTPEERRRSRLKTYRLTEGQYEAMLAAQGGACAGCGLAAGQAGRRFAVDHDHACCPGSKSSCGKCVRGLLCSRCNFVVGHAYDNPQTLERLAAYLRTHAQR